MTQALSVRLPDEVYERLRQDAFDQRTTMNALIVEALQKAQFLPVTQVRTDINPPRYPGRVSQDRSGQD